MSQEPPVSSSTVLEEPDDALDVAWLAAPSHRSRFRGGLLVVLAVLLVFLGGVEVQKRWGPADASTPTAQSFPTGGFSGLPSRAGTTGSTSGTPTPAVIGTLTGIHGHTWTVQDLGGRSHTVKVTADTMLTRSLTQASGPIRTGSTVTVQGTTRGHTVTATAVTVR